MGTTGFSLVFSIPEEAWKQVIWLESLLQGLDFFKQGFLLAREKNF